MDETQFKQLSDKMDTIIRLLALNAVEGKELKTQVSMLSGFGFQPKQIADMLWKTPNHIRVLLHEMRKGNIPKEEGVEDKQTNQSEGGTDA